MKVSRQAFLYLHFRFELFLAQEYWRKCAYKMLVKLTTGRLGKVPKANEEKGVFEDQL
jgi:hypothetical protein